MEQLLDVSELEPPEPLERILESVKDLWQGQYLHVRHRREPLLLYPLLEKMALNQDTCCDAHGTYHIVIWREGDLSAEAEARQAVSECCKT